MTAVALFIVLMLAKVAGMAGHGIPLSPWSIVGYAWQDAVVALVFGVVHRLTLHQRHVRAGVAVVYWTLIGYAALNIPIGRALGTPLTWPMLRATRGALADSLLLHATWTNAALMTATVAAAIALPRLCQRLPRSFPSRAAVCALALIGLAPLASTRLDARGRDRNVVVALVQSGIPYVRSHAAASDWRLSRFGTPPGDDLSPLRGAMGGRNVVIISLESTAAQYLPLYGGADDVMPALTALARNSVVFNRAYAGHPESIKGLFSVLCSTFPAFDVDSDALSQLPCRPLPALLQNAGYATALFHSGRFDYLGMEAVVTNRGYDVLEDAGDISGNHRSSFGVDEPSTVQRMLRWVDAVPRDQPFFLTYLPIAGHHPYETPAAGVFPNDNEFGRYRNALRYGDASLAVLIDGLRTRGLDHETVWIVFGDHGEAFGQHEGNYGHTFFLFDENVRVPFIIVAPGIISGQAHVNRVISLVDTAPTILDLLGQEVPGEYQGTSALNAAARMALFFADYSLPLAGLADGRWKAVHELNSGRTRLFDLDADAGETRDISAAFPDRTAWYAETLRRWTAAQKHYLRKRDP
jgi:arylsulfatase A-like enzyme